MYNLFVNRYTVLSIVFLVIQQVIVAFSTYLLIKIGKINNTYSLQEVFPLLMWFIASLFVVYVPDILMSTFIEKSKYEILKSYIFRFKSNYFGKIEFHNNESRKEIESWITNETRALIDSYLTFIFDFLALLFNVTFNIFILGLVLSKELLFYYIIGFLVLSLITFLANKNIYLAADKYQVAKQKLSNILLFTWDNIIFGNKKNYDYWRHDFESHIENTKSRASKHQMLLKLYSSIAVIAGLLPIIYGSYMLIIANNSLFWAIIITIHRQVAIIQNFQVISLYILCTASFNKRLNMCYSVLHKKSNIGKLAKYINWEQINFIYNKKAVEGELHDFNNLFNYLHKVRTGRVTIIGQNGSGKTTLLLLLKRSFKDRAFYLPTQHKLFFESNDNKKQLSTGQDKYKQIKTLLKNSEILLLDEWDANLDTTNIHKIEKEIQTFSLKNLIIEVKHRKL